MKTIKIDEKALNFLVDLVGNNSANELHKFGFIDDRGFKYFAENDYKVYDILRNAQDSNENEQNEASDSQEVANAKVRQMLVDAGKKAATDEDYLDILANHLKKR